MPNNAELTAQRWQNQLRRNEVAAELEQRRAFNAEHGEIELPRAQEEPTASPQHPQPTYRTMTDAERAPWDAWLDEGLQDAINKIHAAAQVAFDDKQKQINELKAEILKLRADLTRPKSWWSKGK